MQQLFFVFKLSADLTPAQAEQQIAALLAEAHAEVAKQVCREQDGFYYVLVKLTAALAEETVNSLKQDLLQGRYAFDILFSHDFPLCNKADTKGALVMDMDMTTVQIEGIDEIARRVGVYDQVAAITSSAMHGHLEFSESLQRRVALLKGGDAKSILAEVRAMMPETSGLATLMAKCQEFRQLNGFEICIASGGFHNLISRIDESYHLDHIRANRLGVAADGTFTGLVDGPIVDGKVKAHLVKELKDSGIPMERIIVMGDGANDVLMMKEGGLGIAYHAKPKVQEQQLNALNYGDLSAVAMLLSLRGEL